MRLSNLVRDANGWETKSRSTRYVDDHLEVTTEDVKTPFHLKGKSWTIVYRKPAVVVAPMTRDGKFVLVQEERVPIREAIWEMPAGQIDENLAPTREQIETTALREMREETGYKLAEDGELIALGGLLFFARFHRRAHLSFSGATGRDLPRRRRK